MIRHIFLTGKKQVGKSTLIQKVLKRYTGNIGGFFTVRTNEYLKDSCSVHIFRMEEEKTPDEDNLLFVCGKPGANVSDRFDRMGCEILSECLGCSLIVMDELGPHEADAALFHEAVLKSLDENIPIFGILQAPAEDNWPDIVNHPDVKVIEITEHNRNDAKLIDNILSVLTNTHS